MGLVGPKPRLKGVGDGQQVNIPVQFVFRPNKPGGRCFVLISLRWMMNVSLTERGVKLGGTQVDTLSRLLNSGARD